MKTFNILLMKMLQKNEHTENSRPKQTKKRSDMTDTYCISSECALCAISNYKFGLSHDLITISSTYTWTNAWHTNTHTEK